MKKLFLAILFINIFSLYSQAQTTSIPDTDFESKLIQLSIDSDGLVNGQILNSDAVGITILNLDSSNISDLTGLAAFSSLTQLTCSANLLTSINTSNNPNLNTLSCSANLLTSINTSNNPNLEYLSCSDNLLTSINTSNNPNLETLHCGYNQLTSLNTSNNPNLEFLACSDNLLASLNTSNNPNLGYLFCSNNLLTSLNTSNNSNIGYLSCSDNLLTSLNTSNNPNLEILACSDNLLTSLNTSNNPNLKSLYCHVNQLTSLELSNNSLLLHLRIEFNYFNYINIKNNPLTHFKADNNPANLLICVNDSIAANNNLLWLKDSTATYIERCPNTSLVGHVKLDMNNNCQIDALEPIIKNTIIQISSTTDTTYKVSNAYGKYSTELDSGTYTLSITPPNPYLNPCINPKSTTIDSLNDLDTVNWSLQATHYCPYLHASISAPFLRMTGGGSAYTINYCNNGTAPAYAAYIEVTLDSFLNIQGTGLPIISQLNNVYTFNLDTINIGECGSFYINVIVDTSAQIGQVHCSEVHIYPDSLCNNTWTGPIIEAESVCNNDTITFKLKNVGSLMTSSRNYLVIEDNLVMFTNPFTLGAGLSTTIQVAAQPGKTYRIEAQQAIAYPAVLGPNIAYANTQNCNGTSTNLNIPLQYYNGNTAPWIDTDCQANVAAYDPNDKTAQQIGYGSQNYIERGTPLDYKVRFQNTGNDTAFHITILDTISTHLDLSTLQMKTASHNYNWQIVNGHTLRVDFPNVKLVDSLTNEPLSHGFFRYEIQQKSNLPLETVINNQAAIYFDYNPPIFTNTTLHTIGENYIPIILSMPQTWVEEMQVHLYPNPTSGLVYIEQLSGEELQIKVFDNLGRVVLQKNSTSKKSTINLNSLPQGVYYINIQQDHKLSTHKVVKY
jgi:hypothetical protein